MRRLVLMLALVVLGAGPARAADTLQLPLVVGDRAPDVAVITTQGQFVLSDAKKPTLLEIFATWCPHCQRETAVLNALHTSFAGAYDIVAVSGSAHGMDGTSPESLADVEAFGRAFDVTYAMAFDPKLTVARAYRIEGYPTLVVIDRNRTIRYIESGEVPFETLHAIMATALGVPAGKG